MKLSLEGKGPTQEWPRLYCSKRKEIKHGKTHNKKNITISSLTTYLARPPEQLRKNVGHLLLLVAFGRSRKTTGPILPLKSKYLQHGLTDFN